MNIALPYTNQHQFHDNFIHGFQFVGENYASELHLDIDHILEWPDCIGEDRSMFKVSRASLKFHHVTDLRINIDWGDSGYTTAVQGIRIEAVDRQKVETTLRLPTYYKWEITMCDGRSKLLFGSSEMSLELIGEPLRVNRQYLLKDERSA